MGFFSKVKKGFKKVWGGIKKVFKKVGKFIGKILNTGWGKALMLVAAVFTAGMALAAGFGAAAAEVGFAAKFMAGAKAFMGALVNPIANAKEVFGGAAQAATTSQKIAAGTAIEGAGAAEGILAGAEGAAGASAGDAILAGGAEAAAGSAPAAVSAGADYAAITKAAAEAAAKKPGLLARAGGAAVDIAKSTGGGQIIAGAIEGYAGGSVAEEQLKAEKKERRYYDKAWRDTVGLKALKGAVADPIDVPGGYLRRAMNTGEQVTNFTPRVRLKAAGG